MFAKIYLSVSLLAIFHLINPRNSLLLSLLKLENPPPPNFRGRDVSSKDISCVQIYEKTFEKLQRNNKKNRTSID